MIKYLSFGAGVEGVDIKLNTPFVGQQCHQGILLPPTPHSLGCLAVHQAKCLTA